MDHLEAGRLWDASAEAWTRLARAGYDVYRDHLNTPAFLAMLPEVRGLAGLDIGCGEGHNTRRLAERGAVMTALDLSPTFLSHARDQERADPRGIAFVLGSAVELPFESARFDFATGFMSFMDVPETDSVLAEAHRVLRPGGFLQFSITHPATDTPHRRNLRDGTGKTYAIEVGCYFENQQGRIAEWTFSAAPPQAREGLAPFRLPVFTRTLSQWLNLLIATGFRIERLEEPRPTDEQVAACPAIQDAQVAPYFLHIRVRKPA